MTKRGTPVFDVWYDPIDWNSIFSRGQFQTDVSEEQAGLLNRARMRALQKVFVGEDGKAGYMTVFDRQDEWDICCVLDGCRYDTFKELNEFRGELEQIISPGYNTGSWHQKTYVVPHKDLVLVSGNWCTSRFLEEDYLEKQLHHYERLWETDYDLRLRTVFPDIMTEAAIKLHEKYPTKKLLIHYMQPHDPFITNPDLSLRSEPIKWVENFIEANHFTYTEMYEFYKDNLRLVLESIEQLVKYTTGKIVITSDHGEGFGECGAAWAHAGGYMPWLVEIPWFRMETQ